MVLWGAGASSRAGGWCTWAYAYEGREGAHDCGRAEGGCVSARGPRARAPSTRRRNLRPRPPFCSRASYDAAPRAAGGVRWSRAYGVFKPRPRHPSLYVGFGAKSLGRVYLCVFVRVSAARRRERASRSAPTQPAPPARAPFSGPGSPQRRMQSVGLPSGEPEPASVRAAFPGRSGRAELPRCRPDPDVETPGPARPRRRPLWTIRPANPVLPSAPPFSR